ncbi:hypothetical protein CLOM_g2163 [Closterium sp. NIES-68]|nr:hypothetical protein CLOM_g407 [Closterium sp. NIES-68]GJP42616.1 hypothetical protein CLOM_g2163 [Closterium sp. NIES-68]GJP59661.1 hypothetical protein CLOP_g14384 [Closterium sp. NIES-67]GJP68779.1 hypothetical protein CLOP_g25440 [Closterium sp. NIES-67]
MKRSSALDHNSSAFALAIALCAINIFLLAALAVILAQPGLSPLSFQKSAEPRLDNTAEADVEARQVPQLSNSFGNGEIEVQVEVEQTLDVKDVHHNEAPYNEDGSASLEAKQEIEWDDEGYVSRESLQALASDVAVNGTVVVLVTNIGYADFLLNWAVYAGELGYGRNFLVFAEDMESFDLLRERFPRQVLRWHVPEIEQAGEAELRAAGIGEGEGEGAKQGEAERKAGGTAEGQVQRGSRRRRLLSDRGSGGSVSSGEDNSSSSTSGSSGSSDNSSSSSSSSSSGGGSGGGGGGGSDNSARSSSGGSGSSSLAYATAGFKRMMYRRVAYIRTLLDMGFNVLICDSDFIWMKDPLPFVHATPPPQAIRDSRSDGDAFPVRGYDVVGVRELPDSADFNATGTYPMARDSANIQTAKVCGGFVFLRSSPGGRLVLDAWSLKIARAVRIRGNENDQFYLGVAVSDVIKMSPAPLVGVLPQKLFPPGWLYFRGDSNMPPGTREEPWWQLEEEEKVRVVTVHNNWLMGKGKKLARFKKNKLWKLE